jgi:hypothetical protein
MVAHRLLWRGGDLLKEPDEC